MKKGIFIQFNQQNSASETQYKIHLELLKQFIAFRKLIHDWFYEEGILLDVAEIYHKFDDMLKDEIQKQQNILTGIVSDEFKHQYLCKI